MRLLRIAPNELRSNRRNELIRLAGENFDVDSRSWSGLETLRQWFRDEDFDAVVFDVMPVGAQKQALKVLREIPVLRPIREQVHTTRGEVLEDFVGYGQLQPDGTVKELPDGAFLKR